MKTLKALMFWKKDSKKPKKPKKPKGVKPKKKDSFHSAHEEEGEGDNPFGLMTLKNLPQPNWTQFEDANSFEPEEHTVMYCMNGQDNVPSRIKLKNGFVYYISQNRSPGHKEQGQDCMAFACHGNWEVHVLCDGHDKAGHMVALGVCQQLPRVILRKIMERGDSVGENEHVSDALVNESFDETAKVVCWTKEGITVGLWVKVFEGQYAEKPGFIKESSGHNKVKVAIIDKEGYHLPVLAKSELRRPRYTGGCTCTCLIRNKVTKEIKVATSGDSRFLMLPTMGVNDEVLFPQMGLEEPDRECPEGMITPAHNVFNEDEKDRLEKDFAGQYEFDGNFLVNPVTKFAIQPTRGFGDFDMFGTGYTHRPEITKTFKLQDGGMVLMASDGLFDTHVWADEEIVSCLDKFLDDGLTNVQIIDRMYRETLERSLEGGYVDDISLLCFVEGSGEKKSKEKITQVKDLPTKEKVKQTKDVAGNRRTIGRGENDFSNLNEKLQALRKQRELEKASNAMNEESINEIILEDAKVKEGLGEVIGNLAKSERVKDKVDPNAILGESGEIDELVGEE